MLRCRSMALAGVLTLLAVLTGPTAADAQQSGSFRVSNYGSGTVTDNWHWRGYYFEVSRETTLTHLIGGGGATPTGRNVDGDWNAADPFWVGLYEAGRSGNTITLTSLLTAPDLTWADVTPDQELPVGDIVLQPGQGYFIGQGRSGSAGHHWTLDNSSGDGLVVDDLLQNPIIQDWAPNPGAGNPARAYNLQNGGPSTTPQSWENHSTSANTNVLPRIGFRFETDHVEAELPQIAPSSSFLAGETSLQLSGTLENSGVPDGGEATLFFQFAENSSDFDNAGTTRAANPGTGGDGTEFALSIDVNPGSTYYFRAMAINEAGVTHGPGGSFEVPSLSEIALTKIHQYADDPYAPTPTTQDYADAGVTGVTSDNVGTLNEFVQGSDPADLPGAQAIQGIVDDLPMLVIRRYADDPNAPAPTTQDYADAGVTGVSAENLEALNALVQVRSPGAFPDHAEVQALADLLTMATLSTVSLPDAGRTGETVNIEVTLRSEVDGAPVSGLRSQLSIRIRGGNPGSAFVSERSDGTYRGIYTPSREGTDEIMVTISDVELAQSPLELVVGEHIVLPDSPGTPRGTPGSGQVELSWDTPPDDGGAPVLSYRVQRSVDGGASWADAVLHQPRTNRLTVTGLTNSRAYRFRVAAVTEFGQGPYSEASDRFIPSAPVAGPDGHEGDLPELDSGEARSTAGGMTESVETVWSGASQLELEAGSRKVTLQSRDADGQPLPAGGGEGGEVMQLVPAGSLDLSGLGLSAGSGVTVWLSSRDERIGDVEVGADGAMSGAVALPHDLSAGVITLQVVGLDADGNEFAFSLGVQVGQVVPNLRIVMNASDPTPAPGDTIVVEITVTNEGAATAQSVVVDGGLLNQRLLPVKTTPAQGHVEMDNDRWHVGDLAPGASATLVIEAVVANPDDADPVELR